MTILAIFYETEAKHNTSVILTRQEVISLNPQLMFTGGDCFHISKSLSYSSLKSNYVSPIVAYSKLPQLAHAYSIVVAKCSN
jgi:hypothetical protein